MINTRFRENLKKKAVNIDWKDIYDENFVETNFADLNEGDIVKSYTMTYSQKYFREGYEDYNTTKKGVLIKKDIDSPEYSIIYYYNSYNNKYEESRFYADPGSSGIYVLYKYKETPK